MADGNNIRCFSPDCKCGCEKASNEMSRSFRKRRRGTKAATGAPSVGIAKEQAVEEAALEQPADSTSGP